MSSMLFFAILTPAIAYIEACGDVSCDSLEILPF